MQVLVATESAVEVPVHKDQESRVRLTSYYYIATPVTDYILILHTAV